MDNEKMNHFYVDDKSFDEFVDMLKMHEIKLDKFIYGSSGTSNHADCECLAKSLQVINTDALYDLKRLISNLDYLKQAQGSFAVKSFFNKSL